MRPHHHHGYIIWPEEQLLISSKNGASTVKRLELDLILKILKKCWPCRKICHFYKVFNDQSAVYLFKIILTVGMAFNARNTDSITYSNMFFHKFLFPFSLCCMEYIINNLDLNIRNSEIHTVFRKTISKLVRSSRNTIFSC